MSMDSSKLLQEDKDEWFYQSMKRYKNLYMFELEFTVDSIQIINDIDICLSGLQQFSKKCEILHLSIPPKLLPKDIEEGLCKDRDFKIISGGYANNRILQIKSLPESKVATVQKDVKGVYIFELGNDDQAIIKEKQLLKFSSPQEDSNWNPPRVIETLNNRILAAGDDFLYEWKIDNADLTGLQYKLPKDIGEIRKVKFWDENQISFCSESGLFCNYDLRTNNLSFTQQASKNNFETESQPPHLIYTFDTIPSLNKYCILDSCDGYEVFDIRKEKKEDGERQRLIIPDSDSKKVFKNNFNIQFEPIFLNKNNSAADTDTESNEKCFDFIITGRKEDVVQIYRDNGKEVNSLFTHNGHMKPVNNALWHPISENFLISTSIDAVLHAWQYNEEIIADA